MARREIETKPSSASVSPRPLETDKATPGSAAPLSEFQNLGNGILFFDPLLSPSPSPLPSPQSHNHNHNHNHEHPQPQPQPQPQLIILCTWLGGATPRRIAKYTSGYRSLFPTSPILAIQTVIADFTVRSEQAIRKNLGPARDCVRDILSRSSSSCNCSSSSTSNSALRRKTSPGKGTAETGTGGTGILLHIFSNGGCHLAIQLAHLYLSSSLSFTPSQPPIALPVTLQILDSSPGTFSVSQTYGAAAHSVPSHHPWLLQSIERWGLWGAVVIIAGLQKALPRSVGEDVIRQKILGGVGVDFEGMRGEVLQPKLWREGGEEGNETGRLYLYSKADEAVSYRDVERHVRQAKRLVKERAVKRGLGRGKVQDEVEGLVRAERFETASHCSLLMDDGERYWKAVRESWEGQMERRRLRKREKESRSEEECEDGNVVLGAMDEHGEGQKSGREPGTRSGVEEGVESRDDELSRRNRLSKL
ncbi:hypothetical protein B0T09DRAFT_389468 [Sordaria sp. MPI-SDFR-AT-0083]|nr:hypothetical protein B0T09DRAFT_389468 [Sordaria sp. MPI-SDFR-AT-0083]